MSLLEKHYTQEHRIFREAVRRFYDKEVTPNVEAWEKAGIVPRDLWRKFGEQGVSLPMAP